MGLMPFKRAGSLAAQGARSATPSGRSGASGQVDPTSAKSRWHYRYLALFGVLFSLFLLMTGCSKGKQSTWDPVGPVAEKQLELFNVLLWAMIAVFVLVEGALLYAIIRYRRRPGQERPKQVHGHLPLEIAWTVIPTILILGLGVWSVMALFELDAPPDSEQNVLEVNVTGHQWWWEFEYPDAGGGKRITTANELRIPVDRAVKLNLRSDDVLHSFWVPKLAGKLDVVPTRTNKMWFKADSAKIDTLPATLYGQCAELCGIAHAQMKMRVTVLSQADYDAWVQDYGPPLAVTERAKLGQATFSANCALCHTITGGDDEEAQKSRLQVFLTQKGFTPVPAPNLTDLRTRQSIGAGLLDLSVENLRRWLHNPESIKPGNTMAQRALIYRTGDISLDTDQIDALIGYLLQLH